MVLTVIAPDGYPDTKLIKNGISAYLLLSIFSEMNDALSNRAYKKLYCSNMFDNTDMGNRNGTILRNHIFNPLNAPSDTVPGCTIKIHINSKTNIGIKFFLNITTPIHILFLYKGLYDKYKKYFEEKINIKFWEQLFLFSRLIKQVNNMEVRK